MSFCVRFFFSAIHTFGYGAGAIYTFPISNSFSLLLHQYIAHSDSVSISVISFMFGYVATRVVILGISSCTKSDSRVTAVTIILFITNDTDSCLGKVFFVPGMIIVICIESFLVTVALQWSSRTNQVLPRATPQWCLAISPISDQCEERVSVLIDDNIPELLSNLHAETDLGEGCVPVGR